MAILSSRPHSGQSSTAHVTIKEVLNTREIKVERRLGETEASYYLPSRENGVNDMYLHVGLHASVALVQRPRVSLVWAILRLKHPLLAANIEMDDYHDIRFVYASPMSSKDALDDANCTLEYRCQSKDELINSYLNGPRTLSDRRLSFLIMSHSDLQNTNENAQEDYDFFLCAAHFLGDGMALHQFANDFFTLLGSSISEDDLLKTLEADILLYEHQMRLPTAMEERLSLIGSGRFYDAVCRVDFEISQRKLIGGHAFPRCTKQPRNTVVPTISFAPDITKQILINCKSRGVSISSALFAVCNIAWGKTCEKNWQLPMMMYSALNLRPYLAANKALHDSYWFLAIGYFNIILPTFIPSESSEISDTLWYRARCAKKQSIAAAKNPMAIPRSREMARERGSRARVWAKQDDDKARGISAPSQPPVNKDVKNDVPPSVALMGLSLLGNLDGIYQHASFPAIKLHTLTTGSRQRSGGMLLFGYTFADKLWISFGYDENGFDRETIKIFWSNVLDIVNKILIP